MSCDSGLDGEKGAVTYCDTEAPKGTFRRKVEVVDVDGLLMKFNFIPVYTKNDIAKGLMDILGSGSVNARTRRHATMTWSVKATASSARSAWQPTSRCDPHRHRRRRRDHRLQLRDQGLEPQFGPEAFAC